MDKITQQLAKEYFHKEVATVLLKKIKDGHKLSGFNINPFLLVTLGKGLFGEATSLNMAKSILYPRVLGTSISTTLGDRMQKFCVHVGASPSSTPGMDIEFEDRVSGGKVIMQLKAGPNTINSGDVAPILRDMLSAYRLLQQNRALTMPTFAMGIVYGTMEELSGHYRKIQVSGVGAQPNIPIYIGRDFWHRLTGNSEFYTSLISVFLELFDQEDYSKYLENDLLELSNEIEEKYFTNGSFDASKL